MKKMIIILCIAIFSIMMVNAADATADKKEAPKFPGIFNFNFTIGGGMDAADGKLFETWYNAPWGAQNGAVYGRTAITGGLKFPIQFYSIKLWGKDEFYAIGKTTDPAGNQIRNRFYAGLDNYFTVDKVINIGINFETRLQNKASMNLSTFVPSDVNCYLETRVSPVVDLNGSYDFGFSWGVSEAFRFYLLTANASDKVLEKVQFDGIYFMGFEFMHFAKLDNITGQIYTELDLAYDKFFIKDPNSADTEIKNKMYWLEYYIGVNFNIYGFTPSVGFDLTFDQNDTVTNKDMLYTGIKCGIGYTKDVYSFNLVYVGNTTMNSTYYKANFNDTTTPKWENHIDASFTISL